MGFDGPILDAQAVGVVGMDKCDDVIATVTNAGLRVQDLAELELSGRNVPTILAR